mmetsp:Transcript_42323/g.99391  ORF Transcript_42323/g.99391 Transcript_42323/m.99391 type:complete len:275 (-) Transcript_42323:708-1532(-)
MHRDVGLGAVLHIDRAHTGHAGGVAQHLVELLEQVQLHLAGGHLLHQLVDEDGFGAELVAAVDQVHRDRDVGQVERLLDRGVAAADHAHLLAAVEEAIAGGAATDAAAHEGLLGLQAQVLGRGTGRDDQRVTGVDAAVAGQGERALREVDRVDVIEHDLRLEALGVLLEALHQLRALHAHHVGRPVVDFGGRHQLAALGHAGDQRGLQVGAGGIDRRGVAGRAGAEDEQSVVLGGWGHEGVGRRQTGLQLGAEVKTPRPTVGAGAVRCAKCTPF